jgi:hypothetical protein
MKNKAFSTIRIIIILFILIGGGYFAWQYFGTSREDTNQVIIPESQKKIEHYTQSASIIKIGEQLEMKRSEPYQFAAGSYYYYEIDQNNKILFQYNNLENNESSFSKGDVILQQKGEQTALLQNTELIGPGGESFRIYLTNIPDIVVVNKVAGDMGWYIDYKYYVDIGRKKVVFIVKEDSTFTLAIQKEEGPVIELGLKVDDPCGPERVGDARILDLTLNNSPTEMLDQPTVVQCVDPGGIGPIYEPPFDLQSIGVESDFSKFYFSFVGIEGYDSDLKPQYVWKEDFSIDLK